MLESSLTFHFDFFIYFFLFGENSIKFYYRPFINYRAQHENNYPPDFLYNSSLKKVPFSLKVVKPANQFRVYQIEKTLASFGIGTHP